MRNVMGRQCAALLIDQTDIEAIMQAWPGLSAYGFGCFAQYHREYRHDIVRDLQQSRCQLLAQGEQCSNACRWLSRHSSYELKHYVERSFTKCNCSNGAFIVAAIHLGFDWVQRASVAYFNMDQRSLDRQLVASN